ncbi:MAG TPA: hypothetical protein VFI74_04875 [Candidatus Saccharimonadales bacterium]|nr:hypothetical protein [Candidatus Saccharimonadales bacterium]
MQIKKRVYGRGAEEEQEVREALSQMVLSSLYNTSPGYTANSAAYPDGVMPFVDKHMRYLDAYPKLDAHVYLANLRLKTRLRRSTSSASISS